MNLRRNLEKIFGIIWGQCSAGLQAYLKGLHGYQDKSATFDVVWLIKEAKKATSGIDDKMNPYI